MSNRHKGRYVISEAALIANMHPQTIRNYERVGLILPERTLKGSRRYSEEDIARLIYIGELVARGINLLGVLKIFELELRLLMLEELLNTKNAGDQSIGTALATRKKSSIIIFRK
jgi:MerR family transcriptional regulator/heat shock protein HspR